MRQDVVSRLMGHSACDHPFKRALALQKLREYMESSSHDFGNREVDGEIRDHFIIRDHPGKK